MSKQANRTAHLKIDMIMTLSKTQAFLKLHV